MNDAERDFWNWMEFRICGEFSGFEDPHLRYMWCDGLIPDEYDLHADEPCIRGLAYCGHGGQERWRFTLRLGTNVTSREQIDWQSLRPASDVTGWLSPHPHERMLILDPFATYSDT